MMDLVERKDTKTERKLPKNIRQIGEPGTGTKVFIEDYAYTYLHQLAEENLHPDVIVVDPPRKGCDAQVLQAIATMAPQRLVMVSCNSASLARDCKELASLGYQLVKAAPVDLFPRTTHVETVALLSKCE